MIPHRTLCYLSTQPPEEESGFGEELGIVGYCRRPGLRVVGYETASKERWVSIVLSESNADVPRQEESLQGWQTHFCHFSYLGRWHVKVGYTYSLTHNWHAHNGCWKVSSYFSALHSTLTARSVIPLLSEVFIVRLYREKNEMGFVKAFKLQGPTGAYHFNHLC